MTQPTDRDGPFNPRSDVPIEESVVPVGSPMPRPWLEGHTEEAHRGRNAAGQKLFKYLHKSLRLWPEISGNSEESPSVPSRKSDSSKSLLLLSESVEKIHAHHEAWSAFLRAHRCCGCGLIRPIEVAKPFSPSLQGVNQYDRVAAYVQEVCQNFTELALAGLDNFVETGPGKGVVIDRGLDGYRMECLRPLRSRDLNESKSPCIHCGDSSNPDEESEWKGTHSLIFRFGKGFKEPIHVIQSSPPEVQALYEGIPRVWRPALRWLPGTMELETYTFGKSAYQKFRQRPMYVLILGSFYLLACWRPPVRKGSAKIPKSAPATLSRSRKDWFGWWPW